MTPPIHKVGDRVVDFRGEKHGTVTHVHVSDAPHRSHKVTVKLDVPQGRLDSMTNYESVWQPEVQR